MSAGLHELRAIVTSNRGTISYLNRELSSQRGVIETLKREKLRLEAQADEEKDAHLLEVETLKEKLRVAENERESALATVNAERAERDTLLEMNQRLSERLRQALSTFHTANMKDADETTDLRSHIVRLSRQLERMYDDELRRARETMKESLKEELGEEVRAALRELKTRKESAAMNEEMLKKQVRETIKLRQQVKKLTLDLELSEASLAEYREQKFWMKNAQDFEREEELQALSRISEEASGKERRHIPHEQHNESSARRRGKGRVPNLRLDTLDKRPGAWSSGSPSGPPPGLGAERTVGDPDSVLKADDLLVKAEDSSGESSEATAIESGKVEGSAELPETLSELLHSSRTSQDKSQETDSMEFPKPTDSQGVVSLVPSEEDAVRQIWAEYQKDRGLESVSLSSRGFVRPRSAKSVRDERDESLLAAAQAARERTQALSRQREEKEQDGGGGGGGKPRKGQLRKGTLNLTLPKRPSASPVEALGADPLPYAVDGTKMFQPMNLSRIRETRDKTWTARVSSTAASSSPRVAFVSLTPRTTSDGVGNGDLPQKPRPTKGGSTPRLKRSHTSSSNKELPSSATAGAAGSGIRAVRKQRQRPASATVRREQHSSLRKPASTEEVAVNRVEMALHQTFNFADSSKTRAGGAVQRSKSGPGLTGEQSTGWPGIGKWRSKQVYKPLSSPGRSPKESSRPEGDVKESRRQRKKASSTAQLLDSSRQKEGTLSRSGTVRGHRGPQLRTARN